MGRLRLVNTGIILAALMVLCSLAALPLHAEDTFWQRDMSSPGDWLDGANWSNNIPSSVRRRSGFIDNGGTAVFGTGSVQTEYYFYVGAAATGGMVQTGGSLTINARLVLGDQVGSSGTYDLDGGCLTVVHPDWGHGNMDGTYVGWYGRGTFTQTDGTHSPYKLFVGAYETGNGTYALSGGVLRTENLGIGVRHGGRGGTGVFRQTGGSVDGKHVTISCANGGGDARYELSGMGQLTADTISVFQPWGAAEFVQTGGSTALTSENEFGGRIIVGHASGHWGLLDIRGGVFSAGAAYVGSEVPGMQVSDPGVGGLGMFRHSGGNVSLGSLTIGDRGILGTQVSGTQHSTIQIAGQASLAGDWNVWDENAGFGRFEILSAGSGISGSFSAVTLPGPDWSWGIDDGRTLYVEHVPEPATMSLLGLGAVALLKRRGNSPD